MKNIINFEQYDLKDIFSEIEKGKRLVKNKRIKGLIPLQTAGFENYGIVDFIENKENQNYKNKITADMFGNVFFNPFVFKCDDNVHMLSSKELNYFNGLYLTNCLRKSIKDKYSYGKQLRLKIIAKQKILLPTKKDSSPDYEYMENYMRDLETQKLNKYKSYITKRLKEIENYKETIPLNEKKWGEFYIADISNIISGKDIYESERKIGQVPYISSTSINNGIHSFINNSNSTLDSHYLSVNRNGSVGFSFYHPYLSLLSNDCRKLKIKYNNKFIGHFISTIIMKQKEKYGYGLKLGTERLKKQIILLPINDQNEPDYEYMENYIKKIEHQKIKKYLDYLEKSGR